MEIEVFFLPGKQFSTRRCRAGGTAWRTPARPHSAGSRPGQHQPHPHCARGGSKIGPDSQRSHREFACGPFGSARVGRPAPPRRSLRTETDYQGKLIVKKSSAHLGNSPTRCAQLLHDGSQLCGSTRVASCLARQQRAAGGCHSAEALEAQLGAHLLRTLRPFAPN